MRRELDNRTFAEIKKRLPTLLLSQEPAVFLFRKLWHFAGNNRKHVVLFVSLSFLAQAVHLITPLLFGILIGEIQKHGSSSANITYLYWILSAFIIKEVIFWAFHGPSRMIERVVAFSTSVNYRRYFLEGILSLRLHWHSEHDSGDTIDKVEKATDGMLEFSENVYQIIQVVSRIIGTTAILIWFSPRIGVSVFVCVMGIFGVVLQFDRCLIPQYRILCELANKASAAVFDALSNITTIKILRIESAIHTGVLSWFEASRTLHKKNAYLNEWKWCVGILLFRIIAVLPIGFYLHQQGTDLDVGRFSTLFLYLSELVLALFVFGSQYELLTQWKSEVLNAEPIERAFSQNLKVTRNPIKSWKKLKIQGLSFRYDEQREALLLNGVSMEIKSGERIAIIGESGSGKTTLLKILHGLCPNARASLQIDSQAAFDASLAELDFRTTLVPQEPEIFSATIRENITLGMPCDDKKILEFAKLAVFDGVIAGLPKGLESVINEKGVNLSGGQKQRLALTRALLFGADKDLILLDESTSSVDPENERRIYENILKHFEKKTIISSIHKTNLLPFFNRILKFRQGCLYEQKNS
ncbi:MAG: ABC transporter ATP-binding protein [Myxococcaceae bacterium]